MFTTRKFNINRITAVLFSLLIVSAIYVPSVLAEAAGAATPT